MEPIKMELHRQVVRVRRLIEKWKADDGPTGLHHADGILSGLELLNRAAKGENSSEFLQEMEEFQDGHSKRQAREQMESSRFCVNCEHFQKGTVGESPITRIENGWCLRLAKLERVVSLVSGVIGVVEFGKLLKCSLERAELDKSGNKQLNCGPDGIYFKPYSGR